MLDGGAELLDFAAKLADFGLVLADKSAKMFDLDHFRRFFAGAFFFLDAVFDERENVSVFR